VVGWIMEIVFDVPSVSGYGKHNANGKLDVL
jgi:hypothetical protein